ncbi:uncharacterized protein LOC142523785 [Primulina tabacum]|uniref:uncharacterized protein LOC142523785 n=1 Tax=Primulina tabacum TaxID=48773 RepID=UPI003F5AB120
MVSSRTIRDIQKLTGRNAVLSRFISRSAHRRYTFFQILRKAKRFGWDDQTEKAFQDLKTNLVALPILIKPGPGEKLLIYFSTTDCAVSSVLIHEEGIDQKQVYYVSHALRGLELGYTELEKIALALVITARNLRPYLLSHSIDVLTDSSLGKIMTNPDISKRLYSQGRKKSREYLLMGLLVKKEVVYESF